MGWADPPSDEQGVPPLNLRKAPRQSAKVEQNLAFRWGEELEMQATQYTDRTFCTFFCGAPSTVPVDLLQVR